MFLQACGGGSIGGSGQEPDPVLQDFPLAYVKRPLPLDDDGERETSDIRSPADFFPGAVLYVRDRASPSADERAITIGVFEAGELYDVKDIEASYDGEKIVFAMRAPEIENADEDEQPTWNIWEYEISSATLRRIITSDIVAEEGQDVAPHYLPDGRIVFASTRQERARAILLDENKPQFTTLDEERREEAFALHVMNEDGSEIRQITFNQSHDLDPSVLSSGYILFTRWDAAGARNAMHLYTIRPDGTELSLFYGRHSHEIGTDGETVQFTDAREAPSGQVLSLIRPFTNDRYDASPILIDAAIYTDEFEQIGIGTVVQSAHTNAAGVNVRTDDEPSTGGRFSSVYPLWDGTDRMMTSWSPCRLLVDEVIVACTTDNLAIEDVVEANPLYGVWIRDVGSDTQLPVVLPEENIVYTDVVAAHPRTRPTALIDKLPGIDLDATLADEGVAILDIRSVYDFDGVDTSTNGIGVLADPAQTLAAERPARFLRLTKAVSIPDDDVQDFNNSAFGPQINQLMREIVGYAPIEPDGSVRVKVPADVSFTVSVLDANGRRIGGRHQNWIQLRPGETRTCNGCHTADSEASHGRMGAEFVSINQGSQLTGQPFPNTVARLWTDAGETMAQTRARHSGFADCTVDCAATTPSADIEYTDVWTDPLVRTPDADLFLRYAGLTTPSPALNCEPEWSNRCRVVIHYETHIHPMWDLTRPDPDDTCTACHTIVDVANANAPRVPDAQLDLTDDGPNDNEDRFKAYRELFFADIQQVIDVDDSDGDGDTTELIDLIIEVGLDDDGNPILQPVTATPGPSMSGAGAAQSNFFSVFDPGGTHDGRLDPEELRLIAEWLDIGAQYYNNPFDAPTN